MSASRIDGQLGPRELVVESQHRAFSVPAATVRIRSNGVEFRVPEPLPLWTEMTVRLESEASAAEISCKGVVVACDGNRHSGFLVSLLFFELNPLSELWLRSLAGRRI
jgi:hypothetical protein